MSQRFGNLGQVEKAAQSGIFNLKRVDEIALDCFS